MKHILLTASALRDRLALFFLSVFILGSTAISNAESLSEEEIALIAAALSAIEEDNLLDEILVTARRKVENSDSVPITIRAFNQASIRELTVNTTLDLQQTVSGIFLGGSGSRSNTLYSIRGQGQPVIGQGSPGVVTYFADVPMPNGANAVPQYDIDTIQVLKGPQGTLFGRNTTGGAILTYPAAPTYENEGYIQIAGTDYDGRFAQGALNLRVVDDMLAVRLAGQYQKRKGYTKNIGAGNDQDDLDSKSARLSVLFEPIDVIKNLTVIDYHESDSASSGAILDHASAFPGNDPGTFLRLDILAVEQNARGPRTVDINTPNSLEASKLFGVSNRTDIEFEHVTVTNIIAFRTTEMHIFAQADGLGDVPLETGAAFGVGSGTIATERIKRNILEGTVDREFKQFSEELHIKGNLFDDKLEWLVGRFYLRSEPNGVIASATGVFAPTTQVYQFVKNESNAIFANATLQLLSPLKLNLGIRQTWDEYGLCAGTGETPNANAPAPAQITQCAFLNNASVLESESDATTYTIGLDWKINDKLFSYITHRQGYRSGGLNGPKLGPGLAQFQEFKPEHIQDYEVGLRANWNLGNTSGKVQFAYFQSKSEDVQVSARGVSTVFAQPSIPTLCDTTPTETLFIDGDCDFTNDPAQTALTINAGDVEVDGIDLLISAHIGERFSVEVTSTYQESKTTSYEVPAILSPFVAANEIPVLYSPRKSATAKVQYLVPTSEAFGELALNANYYYSDTFRVSADDFELPAYEITNARVDLNSAFGSDFDIGFYIRNIFDKETPVGPGISLPVYTLVYNEPRIWGVEARYRFESK